MSTSGFPSIVLRIISHAEKYLFLFALFLVGTISAFSKKKKIPALGRLRQVNF
jgi:hypothetical protein